MAWSVFAAILTFSMVPFTWMMMTSTNDAMFELIEGGVVGWDLAQGSVIHWAYLHAFRSLFPLFGAICGFRGLWADVGR
jgi:hypothetical protein